METKELTPPTRKIRRIKEQISLSNTSSHQIVRLIHMVLVSRKKMTWIMRQVFILLPNLPLLLVNPRSGTASTG